MEIVLSVLLGLVCFGCLLEGIDLMIRGTETFLPEILPHQPQLDVVFRSLCGLYFGAGLLVLWAVLHVKEAGSLVYFVGAFVVLSGLGRFYSRCQVGKSSSYYDQRMWLECGLGLVILLVRYLAPY